MSEVAKWSIGPALGVAVLTLLAVLNFTAPVEAQTLLALAEAPMCDFGAIRGGVDWVGAIDTGCALAGIGSLFFAANPFGMAFCAGWALGRVIDNYFL